MLTRVQRLLILINLLGELEVEGVDRPGQQSVKFVPGVSLQVGQDRSHSNLPCVF